MKFENFQSEAIVLLSSSPLKASDLARQTGASSAVYQWLKKMVNAGTVVKGEDGLYRLPDVNDLSEAFVEERIAEVEVIEMRMPRPAMTVAKPDVEKFTTANVDGKVTIVPKNSLTENGLPLSESPRSVSSQLSLLDATGTEKIGNATIQWLPVEKLYPHPDNPRLIYREDIIDTIAQSIADGGFKPEYALLVRPFEDGYQIISGHTRQKAAIKANCQMLPCWVKEMGDVATFMELVLANNQGELSPLEYGIHVLKYVELSKGGRGNEGGLSQYAKLIGKSKQTLSDNKQAATVFNKLSAQVDTLLDKAKHLAVIHKAPEQYWQQLTELLIEKEWSVKQTETIVNAIKEVDIPQVLHGFLNPEYWVKKVIADATSDNPRGIEKKVMLWVNSAVDDLDALPTDQSVWLFDDDGNPYFSTVNLQTKFLEKLPALVNGDQVPSQKKINAIRKELTDWVTECNERHKRWEKAQASKEEAERQQKEEAERINALRVKYAPTGINAELQTLTLADLDNNHFDAIITDPPYLLSNDGFTLRSGKEASVNKNFDDAEGVAISPEEWLPIVTEWLKPGGVIVATCTLHIYHRLEATAKELGLETEREQAIWYKPNSPPQLSPTLLQPDFEYIFLAFKPGDHYFGYEEYREKYGVQPSRVFTISQCSGNEREESEHDTQKPLELMEKLITIYVPPAGLVLDPFAGSGTTAVAAKQLNRIAYWVEKDPGHYSRAETRIETKPFAWEVSHG